MPKLFFVSGIFNTHVIAKSARDALHKVQNVIDGFSEIDGYVVSVNESKGDERKFGDKPGFD